MTDVPNSQRALWTFLGFTLVAPFLAALAVTFGTALLETAGAEAWLPQQRPAVAALGVFAFVWAAIPAGLAGGLMAALVYRSGTFSWFEAAIAAVVAFAAAYTMSPFPHGGLLPGLAFLAGIVGICLQVLLERARIIAK